MGEVGLAPDVSTGDVEKKAQLPDNGTNRIFHPQPIAPESGGPYSITAGGLTGRCGWWPRRQVPGTWIEKPFCACSEVDGILENVQASGTDGTVLRWANEVKGPVVMEGDFDL